MLTTTFTTETYEKLILDSCKTCPSFLIIILQIIYSGEARVVMLWIVAMFM